MMNKANETVKAIKAGNNVSTEELFDLINAFNFTTFSIHDENGKSQLDMQINQFEAYGDVFDFSQEHNEIKCVIKQSDILSSESRYADEIDSVLITCLLPEKRKLNLTIFYVSEDFKTSGSDEYYKTCLEDIQEFLETTLGEEAEYKCATVRLVDRFSTNLKMDCPEKTYINTLDDSDWKLHISDGSNTFEISVIDDCCNAFYRKDSGSFVEIVVRPYGHPFMEVKMLFIKK